MGKLSIWKSVGTINLMDIVYYGDPVLRQVAEPIDEINDDIRALADGMVRTLTFKEGVGLAAPQVGVSKRLIVVDLEAEDYFEIVVNPEIVSTSEAMVDGNEGCLSIPGSEAEVTRHESVVVRGTTLDGGTFELEATDWLARVFQHEIDHLNGVLFIDHIDEAKRLQVLKEFERAKREMKANA